MGMARGYLQRLKQRLARSALVGLCGFLAVLPGSAFSGEKARIPAAVSSPMAVSESRAVTLKKLTETPKAFAGMEVVVVGMVQKSPDAEKIFGEKSYILYRMVITCCEEDAKPVGVIVAKPGASWKQGTWLRVRGRFGVHDTSRGPTLVLTRVRAEKIAPPKSPYLQ